MPRPTIPRNLERFVTVPKRYKIVIGGRGSGKSQSVTDICVMDCQVKGIKIGCFREFQNSIEDSVYSLLKDEITRMGCTGFTTLATTIKCDSGGEFKFRGLSRNADAMKSMHGFKRFWVEEAQTISDESLKLLTPTLREDDSEIWMTANPMSSADPFSKRFINPFQRELDRDGYYEDDMHIIVVSNYSDNPFFPAVLEAERQFDQEHLSAAEYAHIWEGKFNDTVDGSIIPVEWFNSTIDAHLVLNFKQMGATIFTFDPSDERKDGKGDPAGIAVRQGPVVLDVQETMDGDVNEKADWATDWAREYRSDVFRWDCDGLGVSLKRQISTALDGCRIDIDMFKGSESVDDPNEIYQPDIRIDRSNAKTNEQTFRNKRAQYYWYLRDRCYNTHLAVTKGEYRDPETLISLSSEIDCIDRLRSEVCRIPKKKNANGLIQIMSKDDMLKLKPPIPSPNMADCLMMGMKGHTRTMAYQSKARAVTRKTAAGWT